MNNHPMAYMDMLALDAGGHDSSAVLAALIGGDLGPRLLPMGSLAGLLWIESLRRAGVTIRLRTFVGLGLLITVPTLVVSLALLALY
ncbi:MAG TPA: ArsB/NhaD family transporter, partial [Kofleriaceae bacterium]|nr:ArsB/NhaD family transporter [Kofleriaceae bacterium]